MALGFSEALRTKMLEAYNGGIPVDYKAKKAADLAPRIDMAGLDILSIYVGSRPDDPNEQPDPKKLVGRWVVSDFKVNEKVTVKAVTPRYITLKQARDMFDDKDKAPQWLYDAIVRDRGGCRCQDPGAMPPCDVCTTPLKWTEYEDYIDDPQMDWPTYGLNHKCIYCPTGHWCHKLSFAMESDMPALVAEIDRLGPEPFRHKPTIVLHMTERLHDLPNALVVRGGFDSAGYLP